MYFVLCCTISILFPISPQEAQARQWPGGDEDKNNELVDKSKKLKIRTMYCTIAIDRRRGAKRNSMQNQELSVQLVPI